MIYDWSLLNAGKEKRFIIKGVASEFERMMDDRDKAENDFQSFINENAGLFFMYGPKPTYLIISKPQLGNDYIPDLLCIYDNFSLGTQFHLIELESPNDLVYRKEGIPSTDLTRSIQQINDWRIWLKKNYRTFKTLFPLFSDSIHDLCQIDFTIIIGRRLDNNSLLEKRNELARQTGICIRSYDYLLDKLLQSFYFDKHIVPSTEMSHLSEEESNQLSNPFYQTISYSLWKQIESKFRAIHFYGHGWKHVIENRSFSRFFDVFKNDL